LIEKSGRTELAKYFRTEEARINNSKARQLIESAA
jgi:hypothetical protein